MVLLNKIFNPTFLLICLVLILNPLNALANSLEQENSVTPLDTHLNQHLEKAFPLVRKDQPKDLAANYKGLKGWGHLFNLLAARGVGPDYLSSLFQDKRMPSYRNLYFNVDPQESRASYQRRNNRAEINNAMNFYSKHQQDFIKAEERFDVPQSIMLAILQIETRCGGFTGKSRVFHKLARLASAAEPDNIKKNLKRNRRTVKDITLSRVSERALWLENTFLPHAIATIVLAQQSDTHPLDIKGSYSGAIGLPQFLPGNQLTYGIDGNLDGTINLFQPEDAIPSMANFLKNKGWIKKEMTRSDQEAVIWNYNRSHPYVETVLAVADRLATQIKALK